MLKWNCSIGVNDNGKVVGLNNNIDLLQRKIRHNMKELIDNNFIERIGSNKTGEWMVKSEK